MATRHADGARVGVGHYLLLVPIWVGAAWLHVWYGNRHHFFDLGIYWRAVRWWIHGHDLYSFSQPDKVEGSLGFTYPPFAALLLRPLGYLPLGGAQAVFSIVSVATLVLALWLLVRPVAARLRCPAWYATVLVFPFVSWLEPVRETFSFGQINFIVTALIVFDLLVLVPRGSRFAGVAIGLSTAIKLTPAIFVLYLLLTRRWRAAAVAAATAVAAALAGAASMSWRDSWQFWTKLLWQTDRIGRVDRVQNQSLNGMLARLMGAGHDQVLWLVLSVLIIGYGLWRARAAALAGDEITALTLTGLVGSAVSPVTWTHHVQWFAPALIVLVDVVTNRAWSPGRRWAYGVFAVLLYVSVAWSVVTWYDWHIVPKRDNKGVPGFLIDNWYLLLMAVLLIVLPVRRAGAPGRPDESRTAAEREVVALDRR